ncbi:MAG TPA: tetratricopeptide repeat protein, partial [Symbiobacteriaceae bacterium]|nr:tetratricopeptide repeat protein [Symbiobacteriaceae bacterium]
MEESVGIVQFRPAPDFERLRAVMDEDPREVVPQARHFLSQVRPDALTQARTYNLMCYTSACVLKRSCMESVFHGHEAVRLARGIAGQEGQAVLFDGLVNLGTAAERIGEYDRAIEAHQEALGMPLEWIGRGAHEEAVLTYLARVLYYRGRYKEALAVLDQAGAKAAARQDPYADEHLHSQRGRCYLKIEDITRAEQYLSLAASITNGETRYELRPKGQILAGMAILKARQNSHTEVERYAAAALEIADEIADPHAQVEARMALAISAREQKRVRQAVELSGAAGRIAFEY